MAKRKAQLPEGHNAYERAHKLYALIKERAPDQAELLDMLWQQFDLCIPDSAKPKIDPVETPLTQADIETAQRLDELSAQHNPFIDEPFDDVKG